MINRIEDLTGCNIITENGSRYKLTKQAGCGAQGVIYEESSGKYMIKLYYPSGSPSIDSDTLERLRFIKNVKMPKNFVTIIDLITHPYVGYVMERVSEHTSLSSYLIPDQNQPFHKWYNQGRGLLDRIFVGYIIAKAFGELEKINLSYCDISGNNILVNVSKNASVKMIDVDNIYVAGKGTATVLGTPRYIAPEVIKRLKNPDVLSDNYSLAVVLFELLRVGHPYISDEVIDGTPEEEENAYSGNGEYVTDENSTNMLPADVVLTDKLKQLFHRCFVEGKNDRLARPSAREFEYALLDASNKLIKCPSCGAWHYPKKIDRVYAGCPWCESASRPNAMLNFYDIMFDGSDYRTAKVFENGNSKKLINTYVLKSSWKNIVKSLYVLRFDDPMKESLAADNYVSIAHNENGFYIYNEFGKEGIVLKRYGTNVYTAIEKNKAVQIRNGDEIYFEIMERSGIQIECGGKKYSFIRMARFGEV